MSNQVQFITKDIANELRAKVANKLEHAVILELLLCSGLNSKTISKIKISNVDLVKGEVIFLNLSVNDSVKKKVYITKKCSTLIESFVKTRLDSNPYLFKSKLNEKRYSERPINHSTINRIIYQYAEQIGTKIGLSSFKRTLLLNLYANGYSKESIENLLNVSCVSYTSLKNRLKINKLNIEDVDVSDNIPENIPIKPKNVNSSINRLHPETIDLVEVYLSEVKFRKCAETTVYGYRSKLYIFLSLIPKKVAELDFEDVREALELFKVKKKKSSYNNMLTVLNGFFTFLVIEEHINYIPLKKRWRAKRITKGKSRALSVEEQANLELVLDEENLRNRAMSELFLSSGLRLSELARINIDDIHLNNRSVTVIRKGNKKRTVFFSEKCSFILNEYLEERRNTNNNKPLSNNTPLFSRLNDPNIRLSKRHIRRIVNHIGAKVGRNFSPHDYRRTFAVNLKNKGAKLEEIAELLDHDDIDTTDIYVRTGSNDSETKKLYHRAMG